MASRTCQHIFSAAEFARRWRNLRNSMADRDCPFAVIVDSDTIFYLTGFAGTPTTFQALLVPAEGNPQHLLRYAEQASFESSSAIETAQYYNDTDDPIGSLARKVQAFDRPIGNIGIEMASTQLSVARFERLTSALQDHNFVDLSPEIGNQRLIRSGEEIAMHRRAAVVIERALRAGVDACVDGNSERDVGVAVASELVRAGADTPRIGVIGSGARLQEVHGGLSDRILQPGDLVRLEMSNMVNRYWARIMRMVSIGEPAPETRASYKHLRQLQDEQIRRMRPGAIPSELDALVRERLPPGEWAMQLTGYALSFHEPSVIGGDIDRFRIASDETRPLEAGMVLHIYVTCGQMSVSETVVITDHGSERLTRYPRELIVR